MICSQSRFQSRKEIQPYLDELRSIWAGLILQEGPVSQWKNKIEWFLQHPFRKAHPLCECLSFLLMQKAGKFPPPLSLEISSLPISDLCQLAIFRILICDDWELAREILPFCSFPSLGCPEGEYDPKQTKIATELLRCVFDKEKILPETEDPYFLALSKVVQGFGTPPFLEKISKLAQLVSFGGSIELAFATQGEGISLGAINAGPISVPSFGVQVHPLNDPQLFGVDRKISDLQMACVSACPECWVQISHRQNQIETKFFGLTTQTPISFVFYVKASLARIESEVYLPGSLHRYSKQAKKVVFENAGFFFSIENVCPSNMELIPLAGNGCFWDSDFLLSFEIPVHDGRAIFTVV